MLAVWIAVIAVVGALALFVATLVEAARSRRSESRLRAAALANRDAMLDLDHSLDRAIAVLSGQDAPGGGRDTVMVASEALLSEWLDAVQLDLRGHRAIYRHDAACWLAAPEKRVDITAIAGRQWVYAVEDEQRQHLSHEWWRDVMHDERPAGQDSKHTAAGHKASVRSLFDLSGNASLAGAC